MSKSIAIIDTPKGCESCFFKRCMYHHPFWSKEKPNRKGYICELDEQRRLLELDINDETTYFEEKATLALDANKAYTEWIQLGSKMDPQVSIGKVSIDQERKKEEKKINTNKACACDRTCEEVSDYPFGTYDEIFDDLDVHGCYRLCVVEFIKHLQLNGVKVLNSRLESLIIALDKEYGQDDISKCKEIKNAIANGYKRLPCEETE